MKVVLHKQHATKYDLCEILSEENCKCLPYAVVVSWGQTDLQRNGDEESSVQS
jgi:hypothetical protein